MGRLFASLVEPFMALQSRCKKAAHFCEAREARTPAHTPPPRTHHKEPELTHHKWARGHLPNSGYSS